MSVAPPELHPVPDGDRVSIRRRAADGVQTDLVGHLLTEDADRLVLLPEDGPAVTVPAAEVIARRVVPERPVRPTSSPAKLERLLARGWPGLVQRRLGGWLLRAGGGFTSRANSTLAVGDPGVPVGDALDVVRAFSAEHAITPTIQVVHPPDGGQPDTDSAALDSHLARLGWITVTPSLVMVHDVRSMAEVPVPQEVSLSFSDGPDPQWLSCYRPGRLPDVARQVITAAPAEYLTVRVDGAVAGIGRGVRTADWVGLSAVEVVPEHRGRGLGRVITDHLIRRFVEQDGVRTVKFAYLQVEQHNATAIALYRALGFRPHHRYHYRQPAG